MSRERDSPEPIGLGLTSPWILLETYSEGNAAAFEDLERRWDLNPAMGGRPQPGPSFAGPMLIVDNRSGTPIGLAVDRRLPGDVAVFLIYIDPERGRAGLGTVATAMFVSQLFDLGARLVTADVLSFNRDVFTILRKAGIVPQARLREHAYAAGRFWDILIYSFNRKEWLRAIDRYRERLPGGNLRPAAVGGGRSKP